MAFYGELFRKKDEEDIWEELKRMLRNPPTEEEIALKKQQEQTKIDEAISRMFPDEPKPAKEPYLTPEELLSPQDAERYRQKQMVQNNLNASGGEPTGFAAPITQNKQGGLIGNTKVQQMFNKPTNLVNQNNNLVQGLGNSLTQGASSLKKQNTFPNLNKTSDLSNSNLVQGFSNIKQKMSAVPNLADIKLNPISNKIKQTFDNNKNLNGNLLNNINQSYPESSIVLQGGIEKSNLNFGEKVIDKILQNKIATRRSFPVSADMYTDARTDFSRTRANKNATVLEDMSSLDPKTINALKKYGVHSDERGVYHNENSEVSKKFGKSRELKEAFNKNLESIKSGNFKGDDLNFDAKISDAIFNKNRFDRHSSIQHAKLIDAYIDEQGRKHTRIGDDYNFNKRPDSLKNLPNNHGYNLQEKGELENYFTVMDVILEDDNWLDKLRNKLGI